MTTSDTLIAPATERPQLTLFDMCDSCGFTEYISDITGSLTQVAQARAYVLVQLPSGSTLSFCKHHYERMEPSLLASGAIVADDKRGELEVKPGVSAAS